MKSLLTALLLLPVINFGQAKYNTYFEKGNGNQSATYAETIRYFKLLDTDFESIEMREMGTTDSGEPLHIVTFNPAQQFDFAKLSDKVVLLINNGIHAGEPDGIDATMMLFRDLALGKINVPKNTVVVAIPVYNIGGALNRNSTSRVNQEGPEEYGFRGNARNFDLNRDFIKADTRNTRSFATIFHLTKPDVFIDNHVSNGADYQYTLTYIMTQPDKLGQPLGVYFRDEMVPELLASLKQQKIETTPYVNAWETTPDKGFVQFFESPRFATGYTSLFNTLGFVVETHMLKKYADRVKANYAFIQQTIDYTDKHFAAIKAKRIENEKQYTTGKNYPVRWAIDSSKVSQLSFLGYEGSYKKSEATTGNRLFYDRSKPYKRDIRYLDHYKPVKEVVIPQAYVVPQGFWPVIDLLQSNKIEFRQIQNDTVIAVESYRIADYKTSQNAYEGHYPHRDTQVIASQMKANFRKGDYLFSTNQKGVKYLLETLEPEAVDSFFNWNFFDTMLQQKEGYSDYVFEDLAAQLLKSDAKLKSDLELKKKTDAKFAADAKAQLDWIYKHSRYYEKAHLQYPVYRILN
ncbi:MAG TPA: M14 family metallopeptidase [Flavobacterium sp.]|nr:M14 family metallopeptidase [Flavobacterium sp.]